MITSYLKIIYEDIYKLLYLYNKLDYSKKPKDISYRRLFNFALLSSEILYYYKPSHSERDREIILQKFTELYLDYNRYINFYCNIIDPNDIFFDLAQYIRILAGIDIFICINIEDNHIMKEIYKLIRNININFTYFFHYLREENYYECINFRFIIDDINDIQNKISLI